MKKKLIFIITIGVIVLLTANISAGAISDGKTSKILDIIEQNEKIPVGQLEVLNSHELKFSSIGKTIYEAKVLDKKSGKIFAVSIDDKDDIINIEDIESQESHSYREKYGKLEVDLFDHLQKIGDKDNVRIGIWLSSNEKLANPAYENGDKNKELKKIENKHGSIQKPVKDYIKSKGARIIYASKYAPLIYVELSKDNILDIQKRNEVEMISLERKAVPEINSAVPTILAPPVWNYNIGTGVKVAVVEDDGIAFDNPFIPDGIYYMPTSPNIDMHATMVAGVIASVNSEYKGVAPGVSLISANSQDYFESSLIAASDWALENDADILSLSWGIPSDRKLTVMDKYYDYIVSHFPYPTVVKSAGNSAGKITSPGNAWNVITVGAIDDKNTIDWLDDEMASYSSFVDPKSPHKDREKPEVVAVGNRITSTDTMYPWITPAESDGTSFAAPAVAGEAALLMSLNSSLKMWPETVRAVIYASADHNIEGDSRLSEYDGMGAVNVLEAYNIVANKRMGYMTIYKSDSYPVKFEFSAKAGEKKRVVIAWNSESTGAHGLDKLNVDLDLTVKNTTGTYLGTSTSRDNNYEIVEFIAPTTEIYIAEIHKTKWSGNKFKRLGFAVY